MPIEHVHHLHVAQFDFVLLRLVLHELQLLIGAVHVDHVEVVRFLLQRGEVVEELVVPYLQFLHTVRTIATMHRV